MCKSCVISFLHLVPDHDVVPIRSELVEGEDVEPGPLVSGGVEGHTHRILLQ